MLHVKGNRVHHELSRSYFWPNMAEQIKALCNGCIVCKRASIQRKNLSSTFRQADHKDMPLPRQAYGIDFYGHAKGEILVAVDLRTRELSLWFLPTMRLVGIPGFSSFIGTCTILDGKSSRSYMYAEHVMWNCRRCRKAWKKKASNGKQRHQWNDSAAS